MKFKIMPVYIVEVNDPQEALTVFLMARKDGTLDKLFETYIVKRIEEQPAKGWGATIKEQVTGK